MNDERLCEIGNEEGAIEELHKRLRRAGNFHKVVPALCVSEVKRILQDVIDGRDTIQSISFEDSCSVKVSCLSGGSGSDLTFGVEAKDGEVFDYAFVAEADVFDGLRFVFDGEDSLATDLLTESENLLLQDPWKTLLSWERTWKWGGAEGAEELILQKIHSTFVEAGACQGIKALPGTQSVQIRVFKGKAKVCQGSLMYEPEHFQDLNLWNFSPFPGWYPITLGPDLSFQILADPDYKTAHVQMMLLPSE